MRIDRCRGDFGIADGSRAQHDAVGPGLQPAVDRGEIAHAARDLHRHGDRLDDGAHRLAVHRTPLARAVQIDHVQACGALILPAPGDGDGVAGKEELAIVVALHQTDAAAAAQVDGGDHFHGESSSWPARVSTR